MSTDLRQSYLERDILEADGYKLVLLLYRSAIEAVAQARVHVQRGEIQERSRNITKASEILNELALSVDHSAGGEISKNLVELYDYLQFLLAKANSEQIEAPLIEVTSVLNTLLEAWDSLDTPNVPEAPLIENPELASSAGCAPVDYVG